MNQKPKIQYVGQFYIHGSEARQLELQEKKKHAKSKLPLERLRKVEVIYLDPVAIFGIVTALVLLAVMTVGVLQIRDDWKDYQTMSNYVSRLNSENAELKADYRSQYDLEDIRVKAEALGMVPKSQLEVRTVYVTIPQPEPEMTWLVEIQWFLSGLFAKTVIGPIQWCYKQQWAARVSLAAHCWQCQEGGGPWEHSMTACG